MFEEFKDVGIEVHVFGDDFELLFCNFIWVGFGTFFRFQGVSPRVVDVWLSLIGWLKVLPSSEYGISGSGVKKRI